MIAFIRSCAYVYSCAILSSGPEEYTYREVVEYVFESIRTPYPEVRACHHIAAAAAAAAWIIF